MSTQRLFDLLTRRQTLTLGVSAIGLGLADLARLRARPAVSSASERRRRNSCIFLFLFGGPSQIDLWDMKPSAPAEIRGIFRPFATKTPGIRVCEHLPRFAKITDQVCLLRSLTHKMNVHGPACSEVFSGRPYHQAPTTDQANREDWPSLSALAARYGTRRGGLPASVVLPWYLQFPGQPKRIAGQTAGRLGEQHNPFLLRGDLGKPDFRFDGLEQDCSTERMRQRYQLLNKLGRGMDATATQAHQVNHRAAQEMLGRDVGKALDLSREPAGVREQYGQSAVGQSLLLARRLVENGVPLVTVNWQDETITDGVNTCWDTHQNNFAKLKDLLCPLFDQAFPTFIEDLSQRGLLETTLVVAVGEFGRTPKLGQFTQSNNTQRTGRDHWPHAFTAILAGGGVRGGQVYGETTVDGGFVRDKPVTPADLSATILHHLGIDFTQEYEDTFQHQRNRLSEGQAVRDLG